MGPRSFVLSLTLVLLEAAPLAATGDVLVVTGDGVNVRAGPSGDAAVRMRVHSGQEVIELQREGSWVRAEIAGTDGNEGWVHNSLLAPPGADRFEAGAPDEPEEPEVATPQEQPLPYMVEPAAGPTGDLGELARFREAVSYLNERAVAIAGADLFAKVEPGPEGAMQVIATKAWSNLPPASRQSYANTLLDRWTATKVSAGPTVLQIVDPSGEVVMEKTRR